ncbi:solute carrier organic anion transporter family member [Plakobranchus ocellatus]|uniref:Solute carrier organic anion transporter family member n=1 Tax=Plakobranchus ocellatus TaxID=259542 RepID=A0AAV3YWA5_9GAST|nr:solute carrier organic anion transporter family member [Plakobranchus ocellatus]
MSSVTGKDSEKLALTEDSGNHSNGNTPAHEEEESKLFIPESESETLQDKFDPSESGLLDPNTRCGFWGIQAPFLQPLARIECFTGFYSLAALVTSTLNVYVNSQITTLERQFGFSSKQTGLIMAANDIGYLVCVLFLSYSASSFHIPRSLGIATGIFALSGLACSMPFFVFRSSINTMVASIFDTESDDLTATSSGVFGDLCLPNRSALEILQEEDASSSSSSSFVALPSHVVTASLAIIFFGMMLQGFGKSPRYSFTVIYIDDNTGKINTGFYMGIIIASGIFGPFVSYALGGFFSETFVTLQNTSLTPSHPRWIGAWWLGYIVCGGLALLVALPLMWFPRRLPRRGDKKDNSDKEINVENHGAKFSLIPDKESKTTKEKLEGNEPKATRGKFFIKSFLKSLLRLLTNPIYVALVASTCFDIFAVSGTSAYTPKFLEQMFDLPVHIANYILAGKVLCAACLGTFVGGYLSRRLKMTAKPALFFVLLVEGIGLLGGAAGFVFSCEQPDVHNWPGSPETFCSGNCGCQDNTFFAACGSDGKTYYSPCTAGCLDVVDGVYQNCTCIPGAGLAYSGMCSYGCASLYAYVISLGIRSLFGTLSIIPKLVVFIRCVLPKDKGLAIGFSSFMTSLLGWLLGPLIFGSVIDGICTVWDVTSSGDRGRCLLYDNDIFRIKLHAYSTISMLISCGWLLFAAIYAHFTGCLDDPPDEKSKAQGEGHDLDVKAPIYKGDAAKAKKREAQN